MKKCIIRLFLPVTCQKEKKNPESGE